MMLKKGKPTLLITECLMSGAEGIANFSCRIMMLLSFSILKEGKKKSYLRSFPNFGSPWNFIRVDP